jgi:hypothetical protein
MTQRGSTGLSTVLIIIAVAMVGGFLLWLYRTAQSLELSQDPATSVGKVADIGEVSVLQSLGRGVFLVQLTSVEAEGEGSPYPVLMSPDLIAGNIQVYGGDVVSLHGRVYSLNDSIRGQWVEAGAVNEAAAGSIPGIASFLLADSLEVQ